MTTNRPLGPYALWIQAWMTQPEHRMSDASLAQLDSQMTETVATRVEVFETGQNDTLELPVSGTPQEMAIGAEIGPVLTMIDSMGLTDRTLTSGEQHLIQATSWSDRPSIAQLQDLGRELRELTDTGMSPWEDLGYSPTAYLPSELRVIAQAANLPLEDLYQL